MESKLTLVSAPAGFGKTTLLAAWLAAAPPDAPYAAWLSLDQTDSEPTILWAYVVAALHRVQAHVGKSMLSVLRSAHSVPVETLLGTLLNGISAISHPVVLVLDDDHLVDSQAVHEGIAFLVDHLPPQLRVVIASRANPPRRLGRLRARGELAELRAADVRFSTDEAATFLNEVMGLHLSASDVAALEARTEGWIAGLQLAALSIRGRDDLASFIRAFSGDHRYIVDYLVEEVLRHPIRGRQELLAANLDSRVCTWASANCTASRAICTRRRGTCCEARN